MSQCVCSRAQPCAWRAALEGLWEDVRVRAAGPLRRETPSGSVPPTPSPPRTHPAHLSLPQSDFLSLSPSPHVCCGRCLCTQAAPGKAPHRGVPTLRFSKALWNVGTHGALVGSERGAPAPRGPAWGSTPRGSLASCRMGEVGPRTDANTLIRDDSDYLCRQGPLKTFPFLCVWGRGGWRQPPGPFPRKSPAP